AEPRTRLIRNVSPRACIPDRLTIVTTGEFFNRIGPIAAVRFNADYDHFYERNQRCFAKSE
ncbi:hypothetical protein, partial [Sphingorhabdus sp.]|uniref:hypothetical protein n=1 Tax=Sphingorhabdus sp. TaxID=1902408 RepID=UPI0037C518CD